LSGVRRILRQFQLRPRKRWGQNFLNDNNIARKIVEHCDLSPDDYLLEIGPGLGALTPLLARQCQKLLAIDIDRAMEGPLREALQGIDNVVLLFADILSLDIEAQIQESLHLEELKSFKVCGNIPYNITSPIIFSLLESCPHLSQATLMIQKEVAQRLRALPDTKDYGMLTLAVAYHCEVEYVATVSKHCFYPQPEVESAVVRLKPIPGKRIQVKSESRLFGFMKACFQKRRKTILNISAVYFGIEKKEVAHTLQKLGISPQARPENLHLEQFAYIVESFAPQEV
jgi:16S rRNA (adenine1518-N6/adenine1519-N6)-dimethyltransferase